MTDKLDKMTKAISVVSLAIACLAAWKALPLDQELKRLQAQTLQLQNELNLAAAKLNETESMRKLSFDLYKELRNILEKDPRSPRDEEALRVLVESLAEDPFRYKLLSVIAVAASSQEVQRTAAESSVFFKEESETQFDVIPAKGVVNPDLVPAQIGVIGGYRVDIFHCVSEGEKGAELAKKAMTIRSSEDSGIWRVRPLPESINLQPGYRVSGNEIRYNSPDETDVAVTIQNRLRSLGIESTLRPSRQSTYSYVSVFLCS